MLERARSDARVMNFGRISFAVWQGRGALAGGVVVVGLLLWSFASGASAQEGSRFALAPELVVKRSEVEALQIPEYQALRKAQRRGSGLIMVGSGVLAAAAVHVATLGGPTYCYSYNEPNTRLKTPPIAAGVAAALGLGLVIGGAIKLARVPLEFRHARPSRARRITGLVLGALASGLVSSGLLYLVSAPEASPTSWRHRAALSNGRAAGQ
jgi:hypothetical protein